MKTIGILDSRERANPLLTQFAAKVGTLREVTAFVNDKLTSVQSYLNSKQSHLESVQENLSQMRRILELLDGALHAPKPL